MRTGSEILLFENSELKSIVEQFAQDQNVFFERYADAHVKMSEFGHKNLLSEFDQTNV